MVEIWDTSFGEASSRTQATDPTRRETLRIRTPLPGLRGEAKWLAAARPSGAGTGPRSTPWSAKALTREVARDFPVPGGCFLRCHAEVWPGAPVRRGREGGTRWTLIVRAEVGPARCCPILFRHTSGSASAAELDLNPSRPGPAPARLPGVCPDPVRFS